MKLKLAVLLILVLTPLAVIQYHQVGKVSRLERGHLKAGLEHSVQQFALNFDRELTHMFTYFLNRRPPEASRVESYYAELFKNWNNQTPYPKVIANVHRISIDHHHQNFSIENLDPKTGQSQPTSWPDDLMPIKNVLDDPMHLGRWSTFPLFHDIPALVVPLVGKPDDKGHRHRSQFPHTDCLIISLDKQYIQEVVLPDIVGNFVSHNPKNFLVGIYEKDGKPLYETADFPRGAQPDAAANFFGLRVGERRVPKKSQEQVSNQELKQSLHNALMRSPAPQNDHHEHKERLAKPVYFPWEIRVVHRAGSLDAYIHQSHIKNVGINFGVLALLGISIWLLLNAAHRARNLANQQLEFVAGVSHELMTPLTGINSAAQNLQDGLVNEQDRVREYGQMIRKEGGRLVEMVERVLEFAGMQAGRTQYHMVDLLLGQTITEVLEQSTRVLEDSGLQVKTELEQDQVILADRLALQRVLRNLLGNAAKYAPNSGVMEVTTKTTDSMALLEICDKGPGFHTEDLPYLFDPFYRGKKAKDSQIKGSGLGLCLVRNIVKAHGGKIEASNRSGGGARFRIYWPLSNNPAPLTVAQGQNA